jgi:dienelactone hydrolase
MRFRITATFAAMFAMLPSFWTAALAADYAAEGPEPHATTDLPVDAGGASGGKLVVPTGAGPYPLLVTSHGFSANADNQVGWAEHFASYGFVVVVPTFPNTLSPDANIDADAIRALALLYSSAATISPAKGKVDGTRVGLEGHSAGGLATTLAAAKLAPQATVLFDPVDDSAAHGKAALPSVCGPILGIFAGPSSCNNTAGWSAFKATSGGPYTLFDVAHSTHCDGENNPRSLCGPFCGGAADTTRQRSYARYATAFFLARLKGDAAAAAELVEVALKSDIALANVVVHAAPSCAVAPPPSPSDGGAANDASTPPGRDDAGGGGPQNGVDASAGGGDVDGGGASDSPGATSGSGCACRVTSARDSRSSGALTALSMGALVALWAMVARRRRGHARG